MKDFKSYRLGEALKSPPDLNKMKVVITFPDGKQTVVSYNEFSDWALKRRDATLAPKVLKHGTIKVGSITYKLIKK